MKLFQNIFFTQDALPTTESRGDTFDKHLTTERNPEPVCNTQIWSLAPADQQTQQPVAYVMKHPLIETFNRNTKWSNGDANWQSVMVLTR